MIALERGLQLPERIPRPADGVQRETGGRLTTIAFDLNPAEPTASHWSQESHSQLEDDCQ